jgi:hypothetical protein
MSASQIVQKNAASAHGQHRGGYPMIVLNGPINRNQPASFPTTSSQTGEVVVVVVIEVGVLALAAGSSVVVDAVQVVCGVSACGCLCVFVVHVLVRMFSTTYR